jgi:hypothetical protein
MRRLLIPIAAICLMSVTFQALAVTPAEVRVKKAIADTMNADELAAYKQLLAERVNARILDAPRAPADTCTAATFELGSLPYAPAADTTVGAVDNFDLPADTTAPTCAASSACTGAPTGQGNIYAGTGTAPDRAYRIQTDANCSLTITADPTTSWDLSLIVYQTTCSSSLADCNCVDDTGVAGDAESVTLSAIAGTNYFVVIDGYSAGSTPPGPSGPYNLSITGSGCNLVPVELQSFDVEK